MSQVVWPQNYIVGLDSKGKNAYQSLNVFQFITGFASQIRDESNVEVKDNMLQYLAELCEDANDFYGSQLSTVTNKYVVEWRRGVWTGLTHQV